MTRRGSTWLLAALLAALIAVSMSGFVDERSQAHADAALKRALVTFAVARGLNGVISVAQGTDIALEPAGIGVILSAGEILDPINDLIESFSDVMLIAATSLGMQSVLLRMSAWWGTTALLAIVAVLMLLLRWRVWDAPDVVLSVSRRMLAGVVFVRFAIPLLVMANHVLFQVFLLPEQEEATQALQNTTSEIRQLNESTKPAEPEAGLSGRVTRFFQDGLETLDVQKRIEAFRSTLAKTTERIVDLIVLFVLQTVVLPIAILWLLARIARAIAG